MDVDESQSVLIDDEDVDMEPVVILDEDDDDKSNNEKTNELATANTIDLDVEPTTNNGEEAANNNLDNAKNKEPTIENEASFINSLKNNTLMDKIVKRCLNMENAIGMPRVVNKTLLPLYRDANNTFKASDLFRNLLKNTYKSLVRDPDHKFLHVKTLCEELKSGGLRRKVPFVTLATNLKNNGAQWENEGIISSSRAINEYTQEEHNRYDAVVNSNTERGYQSYKDSGKSGYRRKKVGRKRKGKEAKTPSKVVNKKRIQTRSCTIVEKENNDVINLDDSDNESVGNHFEKEDNSNNVIFIDETEATDSRNSNSNKSISGEGINKPANKDSKLEDYNPDKSDLNNEVNQVATIPEETINQNSHKVSPEDTGSNKENDNTNNEGNQLSDDNMDLELLIPQNHLEIVMANIIVPPKRSELDRVAEIEKNIENYKKAIVQLEEEEVTQDSVFSPYVRCAQLKKAIVDCYKELCIINGYSEDIVKRREIRLHVAEGHPRGPAKKLEYFLNSSIDNTGTVAFPDFSDVVNCVVYSNLVDSLGWDKQQIMREAAALFRQCGQALRKGRQKREYRDLLSYVRDREQTDDPAEQDPELLAKLEENKLIARIKEEEILERYVNMENNMSQAENRVGNHTVQFESEQDLSDSDSDDEKNVPVTNNATTAAINTPRETGESSKSNAVSVNLDVTRTNTLNINTATTSNQIKTGHSLVSNISVLGIVPGNIINDILNKRSLPNNLIIDNNQNLPRPNSAIATVNNQCRKGESLLRNNNINSNCLGPPINITKVRTNNPSFVRQCIIGNNLSVPVSENISLVKENVTVQSGMCVIPSNNVTALTTNNPDIMRNVIYGNQLNVLLPNIIPIVTTSINNQCGIGVITPSNIITAVTINNPSSTSDCTFGNSPVKNNIPVATTTANGPFEREESSKTNHISNNNLGITPSNDDNKATEKYNEYLQNFTACTSDGSIAQNNEPSTINSESIKEEIEEMIKKEPIDVQNMLDELGDSFVCKVFDIEDPFLVIEISSDEYSDDEEIK